MTALVLTDLSDVLDNYADVIEGSTSYLGIPGAHSSDEGLLRDGDDEITLTAGSTTTSIAYSSGDWTNDRWVKDETPGFWLVIGDEHRKITAWNNTTKKFTVASAFTAAPASGTTAYIRQGFARMPDAADILDAEAGWDRFFDIRVVGIGEDSGFAGSGIASRRAKMQLLLRTLTYGKPRTAAYAVTSNLAILTEALMLGKHRAAPVRALLASGAGEIIKTTPKVTVAQQTFDVVYWVDCTHK